MLGAIAFACLAVPFVSLQATAQGAAGAAGAQPPAKAAPGPGGAPAERAGEEGTPQRRQQPAAPGCPFRNNKLELLVT
jgi:hypothetical protein